MTGSPISLRIITIMIACVTLVVWVYTAIVQVKWRYMAIAVISWILNVMLYYIIITNSSLVIGRTLFHSWASAVCIHALILVATGGGLLWKKQ